MVTASWTASSDPSSWYSSSVRSAARRCRWPGRGRRSRGSNGSARWREASQPRPPVAVGDQVLQRQDRVVEPRRRPRGRRARRCRPACAARAGRRSRSAPAPRRVRARASSASPRRQRELGVVELERDLCLLARVDARAAAARAWCRAGSAIRSSSRPSGRRCPASIREMYAVEASSPSGLRLGQPLREPGVPDPRSEGRQIDGPEQSGEFAVHVTHSASLPVNRDRFLLFDKP